MLVIRLQRAGRKKTPFYHIVVAEKTSPVKGRYLERVGHYNPMSKEIQVNQERSKYWISQGAQPSQTVARILTKEGTAEAEKFIKARPQKTSNAEIEAKKRAAEEIIKKKEEAEAKKAAELAAAEAAAAAAAEPVAEVIEEPTEALTETVETAEGEEVKTEA